MKKSFLLPLARRGIVLAAALCLTTAVAATAHAQNLDKVRIAYLPTSTTLGLQYGIAKGYYKDVGIEIEFINMASGAGASAAIASGQADVGIAAVPVVIFGRASGVPVKMFLGNVMEGPGHYGTYTDASARSGMKSYADAKGKTLAINAFGTAGEMSARDGLMAAGIAWDDVKKVTIPFPQMAAALELGTADFVVDAEPFHSVIVNSPQIKGVTLQSGMLAKMSGTIMTGSMFTSDDFAARKADVLTRFGRAYTKAQKEILASRDLQIKWTMDVTGIAKDVAEKVPMPLFDNPKVTPDAARPIYDALVRTGMLTKPFPIEDVVLTLPY